jgi:hypothetical protein
MSSTTATAPEVVEFLDAVRVRLADLDPEDQRDILDGLEADLTDLVAERGGQALGDPDAYARELRTAAGLEPGTAGGPASWRSVGGAVISLLDASRHRFDLLVAKLPGDQAAVLTWLRPVWWVLRGWAAVQMLDMVHGRTARANLIPDLGGLGWVLCAVAIGASVAIGRGVVWPGGSQRGAAGRVVVLALNLCAVVVAPVAASQVTDSFNGRYDRGTAVGYERGYRDAQAQGGGPKAGLYADGRWVSNIYPYDAAGKPLVGIQLFDQTGKPVDVVSATECVYDANNQPIARVRQYFPWTDGAAQKHNVFPVPSLVTSEEAPNPDPTAFTGTNRPKVRGYPFARVPRISLPGLLTSITRTPAKALVPGPRTGPITQRDVGC